MTTAPILSLPDFSIPFALEINASSTAIGAVLQQHNHPIAYFSKPFCQRLQHASAYVRELHAIITVIRKWRQYLLGHKFTIFTDHRSLRKLMSQVVQTPEQQFYLAKLLGYDYNIQYKAGSSNIITDSLSRRDNHSPGQYFILSAPHPEFMIQLKGTLLATSEFQKQQEAIHSQSKAYPEFLISDDFIIFKGAIWLDCQNPFIPSLLHEYHATPVGGHFGVKKLCIVFNLTSDGLTCLRTLKPSFDTVHCVNKSNISHEKMLAYCNQFRYPPGFGRIFPWTLSPISPPLMGSPNLHQLILEGAL